MKSRLHLDVSPIDGNAQDEVTRLLGLGAGAHPEGNEFCVFRTLSPRN